MDRREFVKNGAVATSGLLLTRRKAAAFAGALPILVSLQAPESMKTRLALRELCSGLHMLNGAWIVAEVNDNKRAGVRLILTIDNSAFKGAEDYEISATATGAVLRAASEQALLYAVFDFLERQGAVFGIDGTSTPIHTVEELLLPPAGEPWIGAPSFSTRGLLPWPDFLNCISVYNNEDFKAYFASMLRMRFNMFGMHVYTQNNPLAESYLSFDFAGSGHLAATEDTTMTSWGYLPQRTSTYKMGADEFFDRETFGADATRLAADNWDKADRTTELLRNALGFAKQLGIKTGIGFEPYVNPAETLSALPPESKSFPGGLIESRVGRDLLERRLADLLERYPMVDYVWLWQDEDSNWDSRKKNVTLSVTPFVQVHDFLKRHAPGKRLVLCGWGGVARHFEDLHQRLPEDIVFSALDDSLGWDPIGDVFSKLGSRERWPIPWLEDDPSMWLPQFRASRLQASMQQAREFGCQGMLGIHWRHRIVDPTATYFARAAWDKALTSADNYRHYCNTQASGARAKELAAILEGADRNHTISSTFTGTRDKNGFAVVNSISPDYLEGFTYDDAEPELDVLGRQRTVASKLKELTERSASPLERERIAYFSGFVNMTVSYCDAFELAHQIGARLKEAVALRAQGKTADTRSLIVSEAIPLWLKMAPLVRQTMIEFQAVVATRNDQGQLASMQNKFVRIALERLRLSILEFAGELPQSMDAAYASAISADGANRTRLFVPTRPSLLHATDSVRLFIVIPGQRDIAGVKLHSRRMGEQKWTTVVANHAGRAVYAAQLGPFQSGDAAIEYYVSTPGDPATMAAPAEAPINLYTLNVLSS